MNRIGLVGAGTYMLLTILSCLAVFSRRHDPVILPMVLLLNSIIAVLFGLYFGTLHKYLNIDNLTGLANKRCFMRRMKKAFAKGESFAAVMLDINNFKQINDQYGHLEGDKVLKTFAHVLKSITRATDVVSRWGGDEFAVLIYGCGEQEAVMFKERIVTSLTAPICGHQLSISVGFAPFESERFQTAEQMLAMADLMLYEDKMYSKKLSKCTKTLVG